MSARPTARTSGALVAGTTTLFQGNATLNSIIMVPDGTNAATVTAYDNTAGSGKIIAFANLAALATGAQFLNFSNALKCEIGLTIVVTGAGTLAFVSFNGA